MTVALMNVDALYDILQDACLPGLWSKGVALARAGAVIKESISADEITVRVLLKDSPRSPKVQLWPEDEDWFCDCGDRNEACAHAAAAVIAAKNGQIAERSGQESSPGSTTSATPYVRYRFARAEGGLSIDRFIVRGDQEELLQGSLVSLIGGVSSGRIASVAILTSKEDFAADGVLLAKKRGVLERPAMRQLLGALEDCNTVQLESQPVRVSAAPVGMRARIVDDGQGFRLEVLGDSSVTELFENGAALCGDILRPSAEFSVQARTIAPRDVAAFVSETLPELRKRCSLEILTARLPELRQAPARLVLRLEDLDDGSLAVLPKIVYGSPVIAELRGDQLDLLNPKLIPARDREVERQLSRKLQANLHLAVGAISKYRGEEAVRFRESLDGWDIEGQGAQRFKLSGKLEPSISFKGSDFGLAFSTGSGHAEEEAVFRAWRSGESYVPLVEGGFAELPSAWLERHGEVLRALLNARDANGRLPSYVLPELAALAEEMRVAVPDPLKKLRLALDEFEGIREAPLPEDLKAELRDYQKKGVNWLGFLRESGMGAMLADDMGLGKTLQALCAIRGRTLIVAPTSVVHGWAEQIAKFRPELKFSIYHGGSRALESSADVILTTYSILRLDRESLTRSEWDSIVLDEAQTIKNPESQVARAAHALQGKFRIALTGTPIENRLDDLWSQFQFLNPGLLGDRERFVESAGRDPKRLRKRIRPFILRRLKREVAPELPPRTEVTLHCELSQEERALYEAVLASTRKDVIAQLEGPSSVMQLLEALLRLRQACCHPKLLTARSATSSGSSSSKLELLLGSLQESLELGHRALIFSQWTSYLDLIEPELQSSSISFTRLDGGTPNRQQIVADFQREGGPSVMLLSLKAGGVGLNLTAADHVYLLDPWWNPAVEDQAADRAHRIGQKNPVIVHRLVAKDTVEERILALQQRKRELAGAVLEDAAGALQLTKDDLIGLLGL